MAGCDFRLWMEQFVLTDAQWAKMEPHCLGKPTDPGRSGSDNVTVVSRGMRRFKLTFE